jgi:hypothetical protein
MYSVLGSCCGKIEDRQGQARAKYVGISWDQFKGSETYSALLSLEVMNPNNDESGEYGGA